MAPSRINLGLQLAALLVLTCACAFTAAARAELPPLHNSVAAASHDTGVRPCSARLAQGT
jgi:hypothetical protein